MIALNIQLDLAYSFCWCFSTWRGQITAQEKDFTCEKCEVRILGHFFNIHFLFVPNKTKISILIRPIATVVERPP